MFAQRTEEWAAMRCGKFTASRFGDVMSNGRRPDAIGNKAKEYVYELLSETLSGRPADTKEAPALTWGSETEDEARYLYEIDTGRSVTEVGFLSIPELGYVGGSPDGLVSDNGGIEIKCPYNTKQHVKHIEGDLPENYFWQMQGLMWITDREWWDFVSYDPRVAPEYSLFIRRLKRDDVSIDKLKERLEQLKRMMDIKLSTLTERMNEQSDNR